MFVLGIDTETTGLNTKADLVVEVGACLWKVCGQKPLLMMSRLISIPPDAEEALKNFKDAQKIHGIDGTDLGKPFAVGGPEALAELNAMAELADYYVAHNAPFDKGMLEGTAERYGVPLVDRPWIDTVADVPWPDNLKHRTLSYLAAEHGFINPFPHRALFDVLTMLRLLSAYNIEEVIMRMESPTKRVFALTSYDERQKAKDAGFYWNPAEKCWYRDVKLCDFERLAPFPFETRVVDAPC